VWLSGTYLQGNGNKELIRQRWSSRLSTLQKEIEVFGRCLKVHLIAVPPSEDVKNMVKYARLCRKADRKDLAYKIQANTMQSEGCDPLDLSVIVGQSLGSSRIIGSDMFRHRQRMSIRVSHSNVVD
jgi:hypothetical protein